MADRNEALTAAGLLVFNDDAGCSLTSDPESEFEVDGSHAEVSTSWLFSCDAPDQLNQLDDGRIAFGPEAVNHECKGYNEAEHKDAVISSFFGHVYVSFR